MKPLQLSTFKRHHTITNVNRYQIKRGQVVAKITFYYRNTRPHKEITYKVPWLGCKYLSLKSFLDNL